MSLLKRTTSFLILLCFAGIIVIAVSAAPMTGSIRLHLICDGEAVDSGTLTLYRVGKATEGASEYALCPEFEGSGADLTKLNDPDTAQTLARYAQERKIEGNTQEADEAGTVRFAPLQTGLYLIAQWENGSGYEPIRPFLVSIPLVIGESIYYDIDASPKVAQTLQTPTEPVPEDPTAPRLPQTGQLSWPVAFFAILGVMLVVLGWMLRYVKNHEDHET